MRRIPQHVKMIDSAATTVSAGVRVSDYRNAILNIVGSPSANMKIFVKGAIGTGNEYMDAPDFTVASNVRTEASAWDYVECIDLEDGAAIDGDTGVNISGNIIRNMEVNVNGLDWIAVHATAVVAGTVTVVGACFTNA